MSQNLQIWSFLPWSSCRGKPFWGTGRYCSTQVKPSLTPRIKSCSSCSHEPPCTYYLISPCLIFFICKVGTIVALIPVGGSGEWKGLKIDGKHPNVWPTTDAWWVYLLGCCFELVVFICFAKKCLSKAEGSEVFGGKNFSGFREVTWCILSFVTNSLHEVWGCPLSVVNF